MKKLVGLRHSPGGRRRRVVRTASSTASRPESRRSSRRPISKGDIVEQVRRPARSSRSAGRRRLAGLGRRQGDLRRLQLHREEGTAPRRDRSLAAAGAGGHPERPTSSARRATSTARKSSSRTTRDSSSGTKALFDKELAEPAGARSGGAAGQDRARRRSTRPRSSSCRQRRTSSRPS